jgi:hypothetical protein
MDGASAAALWIVDRDRARAGDLGVLLMKPYWPWLIALVWLVGYELWAIASRRPTLSQLVWRLTAAWPPLAALGSALLVLLMLHFWGGLLAPSSWFPFSQETNMDTLIAGFSTLLPALLDTAFDALAVVAAGFVVLLTRRLLQKVGLSLKEDQERQLQYWVKQAVLKAEEIVNARRAAGQPTSTAADKFDLALDDLREKAPGLTSLQASDKIHAALPDLGLGSTATAGRPLLQPLEPAK